MPRYRYKEALIHHESFKPQWIQVRSVSDGIAVLNAIGEGCIKLLGKETIRSKSFCKKADPTVAFSRLIGQPADEVWSRFDQMTDIDLGRLEIASSLPDYFPEDLANLPEESKWRLAHFAGLLIAKCGNVSYEEFRFVGHDEGAMTMAALTEHEIPIARQYVAEFKVQELLARRYKYF